MGNRSKPSKSCEPCRVKRRRCDLKLPSCSQCRRAGINCPGYKDAFTLRLKDETKATASKVRLLKSNPRSELERSSSYDPFGSLQRDLVSDYPQTDVVKNESSFSSDDRLHKACETDQRDPRTYMDTRLLAIVGNAYLQDQAAISYFMYTYVTHSSYSYLPRIYNKLLDQTQDASAKLNLERAVSIPALLLLSQELREPSLQATGRARYTCVLATTQSALEDPQRAVLDSTLSSILPLGLFEALEFRGRADPTGWDAHTLGAATLLEMRGTKQLQSDVSRQLYSHASANIKRRCALRAIRVPNGIRRLHQLLMQLSMEQSVGDAVDSIMLRASVVLEDLAALRVDMAEDKCSPDDWLQRAVGLGNKLDRLLDAMWRGAPYEPIAAGSSNFSSTTSVSFQSELPSFSDPFHIYPTTRIAKRWNELRMMRLIVSELIRDTIRATTLTAGLRNEQHSFCSHHNPDLAQHFVRATDAGAHVSNGILQSVPYMLQMSDANRLTASALVLPLTTVAISDMAPVGLRLVAQESLQYMHRDLSVPLSEESLHVIREKESLEMWHTIPSSL